MNGNIHPFQMSMPDNNMSWFSFPVEPVFFRQGSDKYFSLPVNPSEQCWIDFGMRVYIAKVFCASIQEHEGRLFVTSPSEKQVIDFGRVSLFRNETDDKLVLGKTGFYQRICELCGFNIIILVADSEDSAFNRAHRLRINEVRFVNYPTLNGGAWKGSKKLG